MICNFFIVPTYLEIQWHYKKCHEMSWAKDLKAWHYSFCKFVKLHSPKHHLRSHPKKKNQFLFGFYLKEGRQKSTVILCPFSIMPVLGALEVKKGLLEDKGTRNSETQMLFKAKPILQSELYLNVPLTLI